MKKSFLFLTLIISLFLTSCGNMVDIYSKKNGNAYITVTLPGQKNSLNASRSVYTDDELEILRNNSDLIYTIEIYKDNSENNKKTKTINSWEADENGKIAVSFTVTPGIWNVNCYVSSSDGKYTNFAFSHGTAEAKVGENTPANLTMAYNSSNNIESISVIESNPKKDSNGNVIHYNLGETVYPVDAKFLVTFENGFKFIYSLDDFSGVKIASSNRKDLSKDEISNLDFKNSYPAERNMYYMYYQFESINTTVEYSENKYVEILIDALKPTITKNPSSTFINSQRKYSFTAGYDKNAKNMGTITYKWLYGIRSSSIDSVPTNYTDTSITDNLEDENGNVTFYGLNCPSYSQAIPNDNTLNYGRFQFVLTNTDTDGINGITEQTVRSEIAIVEDMKSVETNDAAINHYHNLYDSKIEIPSSYSLILGNLPEKSDFAIRKYFKNSSVKDSDVSDKNQLTEIVYYDIENYIIEISAGFDDSTAFGYLPYVITYSLPYYDFTQSTAVSGSLTVSSELKYLEKEETVYIPTKLAEIPAPDIAFCQINNIVNDFPIRHCDIETKKIYLKDDSREVSSGKELHTNTVYHSINYYPEPYIDEDSKELIVPEKEKIETNFEAYCVCVSENGNDFIDATDLTLNTRLNSYDQHYYYTSLINDGYFDRLVSNPDNSLRVYLKFKSDIENLEYKSYFVDSSEKYFNSPIITFYPYNK